MQDLDVLFMLVCDGGWREENRGKGVGGSKGAAGSAESSGLRCPLSWEVQESAENHRGREFQVEVQVLRP